MIKEHIKDIYGAFVIYAVFISALVMHGFTVIYDKFAK